MMYITNDSALTGIAYNKCKTQIYWSRSLKSFVKIFSLERFNINQKIRDVWLKIKETDSKTYIKHP